MAAYVHFATKKTTHSEGLAHKKVNTGPNHMTACLNGYICFCRISKPQILQKTITKSISSCIKSKMSLNCEFRRTSLRTVFSWEARITDNRKSLKVILGRIYST